jgi:WD40 repeat protein
MYEGKERLKHKIWLIVFNFCSGAVNGGLKVHPGREYLVYPLGNTVVIEHVTTKTLTQLSGHTNNVSCIAVSPSGNYLASGQVNHMGFKVINELIVII